MRLMKNVYSEKSIWYLLAFFIACHSLLVILRTQGVGILFTMSCLVWWFALLSSEDATEKLPPKPTQSSTLFGSVVLIASLIRGSSTVHPDAVTFGLPILQGIALTLLYTALRRVWLFKSFLFLLALLPLSVVLIRNVPALMMQQMNMATAAVAHFILRLFQISAHIDQNAIMFPSVTVSVLDACNGMEFIIFISATSLCFLTVFPLLRSADRFLIVLAAIIVGFMVNSLRIALLAVLASHSSPRAQAMFHFFHDQQGSTVFAVIGVCILSSIYLWILSKDVPGPGHS